MVRFLRKLPAVFPIVMVIGLITVALYPLLDQSLGRREALQQIDQVREHRAAFGDGWRRPTTLFRAEISGRGP